MRGEAIEKVLILGGGTAGWLAANYLKRAFPERLDITVIESDQVARIGVGEATVPTLRSTLHFLGLEDQDWIPHTGAGFKSAIKFVNWNHGPSENGGRPDSFYHPFHHQRNNLVDLYGLSYFMDIDARLPLGHYWLEEKLAGREKRPFAYACSPNSRLCDENKAPRSLEAASKTLNYAYHFDAHLFANHLRSVAVKRGVSRVEGKFAKALRKDNGFLSRLVLEDGRSFDADFFIDCTGFRSLLLSQALGTPFTSGASYLLCDSAVALQPVYSDRERQFEPYTSSIALSAGWRWNIPLQHRVGSGYVFSSKFIDRKDAEAELRKSIGEARCEGIQPNHIDMRVGHHETVWNQNCVGIGLAGSFIEPLESTSIFMTEFQLFQLVRHFPAKDCSPALRSQYNKVFRECFLEIRDFVLMHYALSKRSDTPFWPEARKPGRIPDSLREKLALFKERLPLDSDVKHHLFHAFNYTCLLDGFGYLPEKINPAQHYHSSEAGRKLLDSIAKQTEELSRTLPSLVDFCDGLAKKAGVEPPALR